MRKFLITAITLFFTVAAQAQTWEDIRDLTVLVANTQLGGSGVGTGILLDSTHVLTCWHMLQADRDDFLVYTYPMGKVVRAKIEGGNKVDDLMILTLESEVEIKAPPVFQDKYEIGEPITVVGNALGGMLWFVTKGVISGVSQGYILTDTLINPGNSGGPWVNAKGEIVAMTSWGIGPEKHVHGLAGGISAEAINRMLKARARQQSGNSILLQLLQGGN